MSTEHESADDRSSSLFSESQPTPETGRGGWKVMGAVIAAVGIVTLIAIAGGDGAPPRAEPEEVSEVQSWSTPAPPSSTSAPPPSTSAPPPSVPVPPAEVVVLVTVNGADITSADLAAALQALPAQARRVFENDQLEFLDGVIMRKLLLQEAQRRAPASGGAEAPAVANEDTAVRGLLMDDVFSRVQVTEEEIRAFYDENKSKLQGNPSFEDVRVPLARFLADEKRQQALVAYVDGLREKATVTFNESWVAEQKAKLADNPLDHALKTGRPVLADLGAEDCPPCIRMKPVLAELAEEYKGRAEIVVIDTYDYPALARRHRVEVTPTQVFFDASGKQVGRHEGFLSREELLARLKEMGVE